MFLLHVTTLNIVTLYEITSFFSAHLKNHMGQYIFPRQGLNRAPLLQRSTIQPLPWEDGDNFYVFHVYRDKTIVPISSQIHI